MNKIQKNLFTFIIWIALIIFGGWNMSGERGIVYAQFSPGVVLTPTPIPSGAPQHGSTVVANIRVMIQYPDGSKAPLKGAKIDYWATTSKGFIKQKSAVTDTTGRATPALVSCQGQSHLKLQIPNNLPPGGVWSTSVQRPKGTEKFAHIGFIDIGKNPAEESSYDPFERGGDPTHPNFQQVIGVKPSPDLVFDASNKRNIATGITGNQATDIWIDWVYEVQSVTDTPTPTPTLTPTPTAIPTATPTPTPTPTIPPSTPTPTPPLSPCHCDGVEVTSPDPKIVKKGETVNFNIYAYTEQVADGSYPTKVTDIIYEIFKNGARVEGPIRLQPVLADPSYVDRPSGMAERYVGSGSYTIPNRDDAIGVYKIDATYRQTGDGTPENGIVCNYKNLSMSADVEMLIAQTNTKKNIFTQFFNWLLGRSSVNTQSQDASINAQDQQLIPDSDSLQLGTFIPVNDLPKNGCTFANFQVL